MFNAISVLFIASTGKVFHDLSIQHQSSHVFFIGRVDLGKLIHLLYKPFYECNTLSYLCFVSLSSRLAFKCNYFFS